MFLEITTGLVAQWIRHLTTNQGIPGSSPGKVVFFFLVNKIKTLVGEKVKTMRYQTIRTIKKKRSNLKYFVHCYITILLYKDFVGQAFLSFYCKTFIIIVKRPNNQSLNVHPFSDCFILNKVVRKRTSKHCVDDGISRRLAGYWYKFSTSNNHVSVEPH